MLGVYKPPKEELNNLTKILESYLQTIDLKEKIIILGDFNTNLLELDSKQTKELLCFMETYKLTSKVNQVTTNYRTRLDNIFTNISKCVCGVTENMYSYHKGIWSAILNSDQSDDAVNVNQLLPHMQITDSVV